MVNKITVCIADYNDPAHANAIAELMLGYSRDVMGGNNPIPLDIRGRIAASLAEFGNAYTALAYVDGEAVGLITVLKSFSTFKIKPVLNLHDVFVAPEWRGKGVARQMLSQVERLANELNCCKLTLEVLSNNKAAQSLYKSSGFAPYVLLDGAGEARFWEKKLDIQTVEQ